MENRDGELPDTYEICCGGKKCPAVKLQDDRSVLVFDTGHEGSVTLNEAQASEFKRWLEQKGY